MAHMGNLLISLDDRREKTLRELAKEMHGGKKGSISETVAEGIDALAKNKRRLRALKHQLALMEKGFVSGLKSKKVYEKRSEIYD